MPDFIDQPAFEIGRRIEMRGSYAWIVVLQPDLANESVSLDFVADLSAVLNQQVRIVHGAALGFEQLRAQTRQPGDDLILITDLDQADADHWRTLDVNRSGLLREGPVVLWLSGAGLARLCQYAPNLRSFIGGSIFHLSTHGDVMTAAERQQRISDLESHFEMTSAEVIARAESGTLPTEPHFVEWLVLLDRGDLV